MKKKLLLALAITIITTLSAMGCAGGNGSNPAGETTVSEDSISGDEIVSADEVISTTQYDDLTMEDTAISENVASMDSVSFDTINNEYAGRPISYNVEDYIFLSMEDTYAWLEPYGFCVSDNSILRYTDDGKEDRTVTFRYSEDGQLETISIDDFGKAEEQWTLYGMHCRLTVEEMKECVREQGAVFFGHNMTFYGTGIGLEKLGIGMLIWGYGSDLIDYMQIDINTENVDFLQDVTLQIEERRIEYETDNGDVFTIAYPEFISEGTKFDNLNDCLYQWVEENGKALVKAENRDNILCEIECMETQAISISFYREGNYPYQSLFTFNYDLVMDNCLEMPDYLEEEVGWHRDYFQERGPYGILSWYINPMQFYATYYNQIAGQEEIVAIWRR